MTNEQAKTLLNNLARADITDEYGDMVDMQPYEEAVEMAIQALSQEPCDDEYIKVPKKALKYRTAGMVAYNAEWLKNHFDIERAVICGAQEPCEDAISRQAVLEIVEREQFKGDAISEIEKLPSVKPQEPKTGHWISIDTGKQVHLKDGMTTESVKCAECDEWLTASDEYACNGNYCPNCGARMESEE